MLLEEVIVGSCFHALLKSYSDDIPIILVDYDRPTIDETLKQPIQIETLVTTRTADAWSMLKFLCSMRGLVVNPGGLEFLRITGNTIAFGTQDMKFERCHLFPSNSVKTDLDIRKVEDKNMHKTIDFMRLKFCNATNIDCIVPKESFIDVIRCFGKKEVLAISTLTKEQLTDFDYSDTIVRFITQKELLKDERLHRPVVTEGFKRNPSLEVVERKVFPLEEVIYKSSKRVKYYDRQKRNDIIKTYCRDNSCVEGSI